MVNDSPAAATLQELVASVPVWYHTLELAPGVVTPGWFDLRPIVDKMPWPDVRGKRCLDIGTYDGYLAFEMERRGAAEVVATDIADHNMWDWPAVMREESPAALAALAGEQKGEGFRIAAEALKSSVKKVAVNIYDLSPADIGTFDVVVCGSLMLHLRDPVRALEAVRKVCSGKFLSAETIDLWLDRISPRKPAARLNHNMPLCQWWLPNRAGHRQMLTSAGFAVERSTGPYTIPYGAGHPPPDSTLRGRADALYQRVFAGQPGVPHAAALAHPAF
jgi:tRNA (mo5U34)-methyltransferase